MKSYNYLEQYGKIAINEPLFRHTSFKIGGPCSCMLYPFDAISLSKAITDIKERNERFAVIGNGSNLLVSDAGFDGVIIKIAESFADMSLNNNVITCGAGAILSKLAVFAYKNSLSGLEFAHGIPGSVGGAVYMNAGAYDGEIKDVARETTYLADDGTIKKLCEHNFSYRKSVFSENAGIILETTFELMPGDTKEIKDKMDDFAKRRREKQPLEYPSAGSIFKRPEGFYAGKLIEDCGLKGYSIGGAQVSEKHSGFIINTGSATCDDVKRLIEHVQNTVYEKFNVQLECEVKLLG